jgi:hypothetical protein
MDTDKGSPGGLKMSAAKDPKEEAKLKKEIAELEARLVDLKARMPEHSIPPAMMAELDDLDERLGAARTRLSELIDKK